MICHSALTIHPLGPACNLLKLQRFKAYGRSGVGLGGNQKLNCLGAVESLCTVYLMCCCIVNVFLVCESEEARKAKEQLPEKIFLLAVSP